MRYDLVDLHLFVAVLDAGSITAGARAAHLALASASARIRALEHALGVRLLERGARGVQPTVAGKALCRHARELLERTRRLDEDLTEHARGLAGSIRLRANTAACTEHLPTAIASFLAERPDVDLDIEERASERIVADVAAGSADIGVVSDAVDTGNLVVFPFHPDRLVLIAPPAHPLATRQGVDYASLGNERFVGLTEDRALQQLLEAKSAGLARRPRLRVRMRSFESIARMVGAGVGVAVAPEAAARRLARPCGVRAVPLIDAWASRRLLLCTRRGTSLSRPGREFLSVLRAT